MEEHPWTWALAAQEREFTELPPASEPPSVHPETVFSALRAAASERAAVVLVVGWCPGAAALIAADASLCGKQILWAVAPGLLRPLADELRGLGDRLPTPGVAVCADAGQLPMILEILPLLGWSLAVISDDPNEVTRVRALRVQRIYAGHFQIERELSDLAHLLERKDSFRQAIPLGWWRGRWKGRAAMCLAAGPSLDRWLPFVREHQDRCLVVAVDLLHHRLESAGIRVDFVVNVDSHELLSERIREPTDPETVMIMPLGGHRRIDQLWARRSYEGADGLAEALLGRDQAFILGTNVGSATLGFAAFCGCSQLLLIGHDLSFPIDNLYSSMVDKVEGVSANIMAKRSVFREIEGNDGTRVLTGPNFQMGVRDLGIILGSFATLGIAAYNLNIGTGVGALLANTLPLPVDWQPPGDGRCPRPGQAPTLAEAGPPAIDLVASLKAQLAAYPGIWREAAGDPRDDVEAYVRLKQHPGTRLAHEAMTTFILGHIFQLYRLALMPADVATSAAVVATSSGIDLALAEGARLIGSVLDGGIFVPPIPASVYSESQLAFFRRLRGAVPVLPPESSDSALIPMVARNWLSLCECVPGIALPPPHSILEGLHVCAALRGRTPPAYLRETLALVAVEPVARHDYVLDFARDAGLVDGDRWLGPGEDHLAGPLAALRAILAGGGTPDEARLAAQWAGCHLQLVPALLSRAAAQPWRADLVAALIADGVIPVEDALAERIIDSHPDVVAACGLLGPWQARTGTGTALAVARRFLAIADLAGARNALNSVPLLDYRTQEAWALRCACEYLAGNLQGIPTLLAEVPSHALRVEAFTGFLKRAVGVPGWIEHLRGSGLEPVPAGVLAEALVAALGATEADRPRLFAIVRDAWRDSQTHAGLAPRERKPMEELGGKIAAAEAVFTRRGETVA